MGEVIINIDNISPIEFYGTNNSRLTLLKKAFPRLKIVSRGNKIKIAGHNDDIEKFTHTVDQMMLLLEKFGQITEKNMDSLLEDVDPFELVKAATSDDVLVYGRNGMLIKAKTPNQHKMVGSSEKNDVLFAIGPAGTGKTYTAVALAVRALKNKLVRKIVLTRPAVEAGESLGFLPGDLKEKIDPYLRPLYDALDDMIPVDKLNYYMQNRIIEIAPLAFMRGRTLDHSFIILDEAQNTTVPQLKMFLTRLGPSAKCIITGDLTQIDLPKNQRSGLSYSIDILKKIEGIGTVFLTQNDVIRHKLVKRIIQAYEQEDKRDRQQKDESKES